MEELFFVKKGRNIDAFISSMVCPHKDHVGSGIISLSARFSFDANAQSP